MARFAGTPVKAVKANNRPKLSNEKLLDRDTLVAEESGQGSSFAKWVRTSAGVRTARLVFFVLLLGVWQYMSTVGTLQLFISSPQQIATTLVDWIVDGTLLENLRVTLFEMVLGFVAGSALAVIVGITLGLMPFLAHVLDPFIAGFYSIPKIGLAPLFILWFGIGLQMKVVLTMTIVFFLVFESTYAGVRDRDEQLVGVLRVMSASRRQVIAKAVLPGAMAHIFVGLKLAIPYSLVGAVFGEIISSNEGMGHLLIRASNVFDTKAIFAALIVLMMVGAGLNTIVSFAENRLMTRGRAQGIGALAR